MKGPRGHLIIKEKSSVGMIDNKIQDNTAESTWELTKLVFK